MSYRVGKVIKSITHRWRAGQIIGQSYRRPINQQRTPDNIFAWHESPVSAVLAIIAIVTQNKIVLSRNNQLMIFDQLRHFLPPLCIHSIVWGIGLGKIVAIIIAQRVYELYIRFEQRNSVDIDPFINEPDPISGQSDYALYKVLSGIHRIMEHNYIAAFYTAIRHKPVPTFDRAVAKFIHKEIIAGEQRLLHRL